MEIFGIGIKTATPDQLAYAKRYGERIEGRDGDTVCIAYHLDDKMFITYVGHVSGCTENC